MMGLNELARLRAWRRRRQLASSARAGTFAQHGIRALLIEWLRRGWRYLVGLAVLTAASALAAHFVVPETFAPYVVGSIATSGAWTGYVLWLSTSGVASLRSGIDGEEFTVYALRRLVRREWRLVNHVMLEYRDLDHALVGPGGVFAIESKYRSRLQSVPDEDLQAWARRAARAARDLHFRTTRLQPVTAVVAIWGPNVAQVVPAPVERSGVVLCAGHDLVDVVSAGEARLDSAAIASVFEALDAYVRQRTIGEERRHGPRPRPIAESLLDALFGILAGIIAIGSLARLDPLVFWYPLGCFAAAAAALVVKGRWRHPRIAAIAVGVFASAAFMAVLAISLEVAERIIT